MPPHPPTPSQALPLWFEMESSRFKDPIFRGFYDVKDSVLAERSLRVDRAPLGRYQVRITKTEEKRHSTKDERDAGCEVKVAPEPPSPTLHVHHLPCRRPLRPRHSVRLGTDAP